MMLMKPIRIVLISFNVELDCYHTYSKEELHEPLIYENFPFGTSLLIEYANTEGATVHRHRLACSPWASYRVPDRSLQWHVDTAFLLLMWRGEMLYWVFASNPCGRS